ncbi:MAG: hypothetical protein JSS27_07500 [Planctomycetes bacterium]|nr:hypothetical protein [Planctomycetota bacterium]
MFGLITTIVGIVLYACFAKGFLGQDGPNWAHMFLVSAAIAVANVICGIVVFPFLGGWTFFVIAPLDIAILKYGCRVVWWRAAVVFVGVLICQILLMVLLAWMNGTPF